MNNLDENPLFQIAQLTKQHHTLKKPLTNDLIKPFLNTNLTVRSVTKGNYITTINTPIHKVYYVMQGIFAMRRSSKEGKNTIRIIKAPTFLGVDCTVLKYDSFYPDNQVLEDCLVLEINKEYFLHSIKENTELCFEILHEICQKFYHSSYRFDQTFFYDPPTKLMIYIVNHWIVNYENTKNHVINVSNSHIAEEIGISTRTFYRAVSKLKTMDLLSIVSGNINVNSEQVARMQSILDDNEDTAALPMFF